MPSPGVGRRRGRIFRGRSRKRVAPGHDRFAAVGAWADTLHAAAASAGITDEEIAEGYVLSCCTKAASDVSVEY